MARRKSHLQQEIHQDVPLTHSLGQEVTLALLRTASLLQRDLARVVEPAGVTLQQYNVLRILRDAGPEGLPTLRIRERMVEEAPGITRLLDRLESAGFVQRRRSEEDRRQVRCHITASGLSLLERLDAPVHAADAAAVAMLAKGDQHTLLELLADLRAGHRGSSQACPDSGEGRSAAGASPPPGPGPSEESGA